MLTITHSLRHSVSENISSRASCDAKQCQNAAISKCPQKTCNIYFFRKCGRGFGTFWSDLHRLNATSRQFHLSLVFTLHSFVPAIKNSIFTAYATYKVYLLDKLNTPKIAKWAVLCSIWKITRAPGVRDKYKSMDNKYNKYEKSHPQNMNSI